MKALDRDELQEDLLRDPAVSILVVSYNTRDMTLVCLESIEHETAARHEVIVVDNASTDGSAAAIRDGHPDVRLIASEENHGFARANNLAAREAAGEYILLLNPDTVVLNGAIDQLLSFAQREPDAKIWGGRTIYGDGSLNDTCAFQRLSPWRVFCRLTGLAVLLGHHQWVSERYGTWAMDTERQVDIVTGCFLLLRRELWEQLGGFGDRYFMYGEEADLCLRAADVADATPMFTPRAQIIHHGGASETVRADKQVRLQAAKITLIRDHFSPGTVAASTAMYRLMPVTRMVGHGLAARLGRGGESVSTWREVWRRRDEWWEGHR